MHNYPPCCVFKAQNKHCNDQRTLSMALPKRNNIPKAMSKLQTLTNLNLSNDSVRLFFLNVK